LQKHYYIFSICLLAKTLYIADPTATRHSLVWGAGQEGLNFIMKKILVIIMFMLPLLWSKEIKVFTLPGNEESFLKMVKDPGVRDFQAISICMR
jgi:hypothetical protein